MSLFGKLKRLGHRTRGTQDIPQESRPETIGFMNYNVSARLETIFSSSRNDHGTTCVDIILVHGFGKGIRDIWTHDNGTFWPLDLLPHSVSNIELLVFRHTVERLVEDAGNSMADVAKELLESLSRRKESARPIVFVCHSLGGILVEEAMNMSYDRHRDILQRIKGIVFLGTPHRASSTAAPTALFGNLVNCVFTGLTRTQAIANIETLARTYNSISERFKEVAQSLCIISFFESQATTPLRTVMVDQTSAILEVSKERQIQLKADHRSIAQFASSNDENYMAFIAEFRVLLQSSIDYTTEIELSNPQLLTEAQEQKNSYHNQSSRIAMQGIQHNYGNQSFYINYNSGAGSRPTIASSDVPSDKTFDETERSVLIALRPSPVGGSEWKGEAQLQGTLQWLQDDGDYSTWLSTASSAVLLVTGSAGYGKSVLAGSIMRMVASLYPELLVCRYFFDGTVQTYDDLRFILRSLMFQIVEKRRKLYKLLKRAVDDATLQGEPLNTSTARLKKLFLTLASHKRTRSMFIVLDAIDECEPGTQVDLVEYIQTCLHAETSSSIKVLVTSRPGSPAVGQFKSDRADMMHLDLNQKQQFVTRDIELLVHKKLQKFVDAGRLHPSAQVESEIALRRAAAGSFLWISLTLDLLEKRRLLSVTEVQQICEQTPADLTKLYARFMDDIPLEDRLWAHKMLLIILMSFRAITFDEINALLVIQPLHRSTRDIERSSLISGPDSILGVLGGLVKVSDSFVHLTHYTLKSYLFDDFNNHDSSLLGFKFNSFDGHKALASACMRYLLLEDITPGVDDQASAGASPTSVGTMKSKEGLDDSVFGNMYETTEEIAVQNLNSMSDRYSLYDYGARYWPYHFANCQEKQEDLVDIAMQLCTPGCQSEWFDYMRTIDEDEKYPVQEDGITISAFYGLEIIVREFIHLGATSTQSGAALYWSAKRGHVSCVRLLLNLHLQDPTPCYHRGHSPLAIASRYGHTECVQELLNTETFGLNEKDADGRTPLSLAAGVGHTDVVAVLRTRKDIEMNITDHWNGSPVMWALESSYLATVQQLWGDKRTDRQHRDNKGRDALSWACGYGFSEAVALFTKQNDLDVNTIDSKGRSPLMHAVLSGDLKTVQRLIRTGRVDGSVKDKEGRNVVSLAADQRNSRILKYLLGKFKNQAEVPDAAGWTPITWSFNITGRTDNASIFLDHGLENINVKDNSGTPIIILAMEWSAFEAAAMLICRDQVDVNAVNSKGNSALFYAAAGGHTHLVRLLLKRKDIDTDVVGNQGISASKMAAQNGFDDICKLIDK